MAPGAEGSYILSEWGGPGSGLGESSSPRKERRRGEGGRPSALGEPPRSVRVFSPSSPLLELVHSPKAGSSVLFQPPSVARRGAGRLKSVRSCCFPKCFSLLSGRRECEGWAPQGRGRLAAGLRLRFPASAKFSGGFVPKFSAPARLRELLAYPLRTAWRRAAGLHISVANEPQTSVHFLPPFMRRLSRSLSAPPLPAACLSCVPKRSRGAPRSLRVPPIPAGSPPVPARCAASRSPFKAALLPPAPGAPPASLLLPIPSFYSSFHY